MSELRLIREDIGELKVRMTSVEEQIGFLHTAVAGVNRRMDRFEDRMGRVEKRLGLVDGAFLEAATPFKGPDA